jgi:hypothetical protein
MNDPHDPVRDPCHDSDHPDHEDAWLRERYPAASADFVERTLARVTADRARIDAEAQRVEEFQFDPGFLEQLETPGVATDFVDHTLHKVMARRQLRESRDRALEHLVRQYKVPSVSADFVRRTLRALGGRAWRPISAAPRRQGVWWAAAAAALLLAAPLLLGPLLLGPANPVGRPTAVYTPVRFGSVMAMGARLRGLRRGDGLVTLAYLGSRQGGDPGPSGERGGKR